MTLNEQIEQAYGDVFGEDPDIVRTVHYKACRGGYFKVYPGARGVQMMDARTGKYDSPSTHGHVKLIPDPDLVRLMERVKKLTGLKVQVYWRKTRAVNTPRAFLDLMCNDHIPTQGDFQCN